MTYDSLFSAIASFFIKGGPFMVLLVGLSLLSLTVAILRGFRLRESVVLPPEVANAVENLEPGDTLEALYHTMEDHPSAMSRILATLISHLNWPKSENLEAVQTKARHEITRLEKGLIVLEMAAGVGPLIGLLGTLSGLVGIFTELGGSGDPVIVARGIAEALNTTMAGLAVAVPSLIAHSYYNRRIEMLAVTMESTASELLAKLYQPSRVR